MPILCAYILVYESASFWRTLNKPAAIVPVVVGDPPEPGGAGVAAAKCPSFSSKSSMIVTVPGIGRAPAVPALYPARDDVKNALYRLLDELVGLPKFFQYSIE